MLAVGDDSGKTSLLDSVTGVTLWEVDLGPRILSVCFSDDCTKLAAGGYGKKLALLDVQTGSMLLEISTGIVKALCFSPDGALLAASNKSGKILLLDILLDAARWTVERSASVKASGFSPDGQCLAACGVDCAVVIYCVSTGTSLWEVSYDNKIRTLCFSPNGSVIAFGEDNGNVVLCDAATGELGEMYACGLFVFDVWFSSDGAELAVLEGTYHEKKILWLDIESGGHREVVTGDCEERRCAGLACACLSPDGSTFALGGRNENCKVSLVDSRTGMPLWEVQRGDSVNSLSFGVKTVLLGVHVKPLQQGTNHDCQGVWTFCVTNIAGSIVAEYDVDLATATLGSFRQAVQVQSGLAAFGLLAGLDGQAAILHGNECQLLADVHSIRALLTFAVDSGEAG